MTEVKETINKELTSEQVLNDLITYKEVVKKFSKANRLSPYKLLMLALSNHFQSTHRDSEGGVRTLRCVSALGVSGLGFCQRV